MSMRIRMYVRVHQDPLRPYMRHLWTLRDAGNSRMAERFATPNLHLRLRDAATVLKY